MELDDDDVLHIGQMYLQNISHIKIQALYGKEIPPGGIIVRLEAMVKDTTRSPKTRSQSAEILADLGTHASLEVLYSVLESDTTPFVQQSCANAIVKLSPQSSLARLVPLFRGANEVKRRLILTALQRIDTKKVIPQLLQLFSAHDPAIRTFAVSRFTQIVDQDAIPYLKKAIDDPHWNVRTIAIDALRNQFDVMPQDILDLFYEALSDEDTEVITNALITLGDAGDDRIVLSTLELLEKERIQKFVAVHVLQQLNTPKAKFALQQIDSQI